ncbi:hypothetical protein [Methylobacterium mesophilicum]
MVGAIYYSIAAALALFLLSNIWIRPLSPAAVENVRGLLQKKDLKHLPLMGSSMGGDGAMLLGALLKADQIIVFSPQANLTSLFLKE